MNVGSTFFTTRGGKKTTSEVPYKEPGYIFKHTVIYFSSVHMTPLPSPTGKQRMFFI